MPSVDIDEIGTVEFPDEMSVDDIKSTINDKIIPQFQKQRLESAPSMRPAFPGALPSESSPAPVPFSVAQSGRMDPNVITPEKQEVFSQAEEEAQKPNVHLPRLPAGMPVYIPGIGVDQSGRSARFVNRAEQNFESMTSKEGLAALPLFLLPGVGRVLAPIVGAPGVVESVKEALHGDIPEAAADFLLNAPMVAHGLVKMPRSIEALRQASDKGLDFSRPSKVDNEIPQKEVILDAIQERPPTEVLQDVRAQPVERPVEVPAEEGAQRVQQGEQGQAPSEVPVMERIVAGEHEIGPVAEVSGEPVGPSIPEGFEIDPSSPVRTLGTKTKLGQESVPTVFKAVKDLLGKKGKLNRQEAVKIMGKTAFREAPVWFKMLFKNDGHELGKIGAEVEEVHGFQGSADPETLLNSILEKKTGKSESNVVRLEKGEADAGNLLLSGERAEGEPPAGSPIRISELNDGDVLTFAGEKVTAEVTPDGTILHGGPRIGRFEPDENWSVIPDKDSYHPATRAEGEDFVGMGGAVPKEFGPSGSSPMAAKFRVLDEERAKRGLPPLLRPDRVPDQAALTRAIGELDRDPGLPDRLVNELASKPRQLDDWETHVLTLRLIEVRDLYYKSAQEAAQAYDDAAQFPDRVHDMRAANARTADWSDKMKALEETLNQSGTSWGRAGRARQLMINEDFSLAGLEMQARASRGGRPITPDERAELQRVSDAHKKASEELAARLAEKEKGLDMVNEAIKKLEAEIKSRPTIQPYILEIAERIGKKLKAQADESRKFLSGASFTLSPEVLFHLSRVGADNIYSLGLDFAKWSAKMVEEIGEKVRPHLQEVFAASKKLIEDEASEPTVRKHKKAVVKVITQPGDEQSKIGKSVQKQVSKGAKANLQPAVNKLARMFIERGIKERNALVAAVHGFLKNYIPDIHRREVIDLISGYGQFKPLKRDPVSIELRDLKGQLREVAKLLDLFEQQPLKKSGLEYPEPRDEQRRLQQQVEAGKKAFGYKQTDPARQLQSSLAKIKKNLTNRISDLEHQIRTKTKIVRDKVESPSDSEVVQLRARRDALKKEFDEVFGKTKLTDEQRAQMIKSRTQKRIAELEDRLKREDYAPAERRGPPPLDEETIRLQAKKKRIERDFEEKKRQWELKNRHWLSRGGDFLVKGERALKLSSPVVFGKLFAAAVTRLATTAVEEGVGGILGHIPIIRDVASAAPREGGLSTQAYIHGLSEMIKKGVQDAKETGKTGAADLDVSIGGKIIDRDWTGFIGRLHGAMKAPVKRMEFTLSLQKRLAHAIRNGVDVSNPVVRSTVEMQALNDGYRSIFMQRGFTADSFNNFVSMIERSKNYPVAGEVTARMARFLFPVVRVPINIVGETFTGIGGVPIASARVMTHVIRGTLKDLGKTAEGQKVADSIMRQFKKGSIGIGLIAVGFFLPENVGGLDWREKRKSTDPKVGGFRIFGTNIPRWMTHAPWFNLMQAGATLRRVMEQRYKGQERGITSGAMAATLGLLEETPFIGEMLEVNKAFGRPDEQTQYWGQLAKGTLVPQIVSKFAEVLDPVEKRKMDSVMDYIQSGIPFARESLPPKPQK